MNPQHANGAAPVTGAAPLVGFQACLVCVCVKSAKENRRSCCDQR